MNKVLHLTHTEIESDSRILKEMGSLAAAGYALSGIGVVLDEDSQKSKVSFETDINSIRLNSRKLKFLPKTLRHALVLIELVVRILPRAIFQRPDVIHCHDTLVLPLGVMAKLFTRAKLVYDAHELESDRNGLSGLQSWLTLSVEKLVWRFVDALIVVGPSIQRWYEDKVGPKLSAIILNSPLISHETEHESDYLRKKFSIPYGRKIFIYVGILGPGRGIDLITQAFTHPDVTSHIVFLGYGEMSDELNRMAAGHQNMHIHPAVAHSQVVSIVQSADYGLCLVQDVSLSDYFCLPNKLFEYCFAGVPVLASDFPDIRAVVSEYGIGECCSLEPDDIRRAIRELENVEKNFRFADLTPLGWQAQERKLVDLYRQILDAGTH